jgi:hypothetical protein
MLGFNGGGMQGGPVARREGDPFGSPAQGGVPARPVLASFANGTDYVPTTGPYKLHKGEAVVTAKRNSHYRSAFHLRKGGLHQWARKHGWSGSDSDKLPESIKAQAANSGNLHVKRMGIFAQNFGHSH